MVVIKISISIRLSLFLHTTVLVSPHLQAWPMDDRSLVVESASVRVFVPHPVRAVVLGTQVVDAFVVTEPAEVMGVIALYPVVLFVAWYP